MRRNLKFAIDQIGAIAWDIGDIKERGSAIGIEVSTTEAREILDDILRNHDANYGINWNTIDMAIQEYRS